MHLNGMRIAVHATLRIKFYGRKFYGRKENIKVNSLHAEPDHLLDTKSDSTLLDLLGICIVQSPLFALRGARIRWYIQILYELLEGRVVYERVVCSFVVE